MTNGAHIFFLFLLIDLYICTVYNVSNFFLFIPYFLNNGISLFVCRAVLYSFDTVGS